MCPGLQRLSWLWPPRTGHCTLGQRFVVQLLPKQMRQNRKGLRNKIIKGLKREKLRWLEMGERGGCAELKQN